MPTANTWCARGRFWENCVTEHFFFPVKDRPALQCHAVCHALQEFQLKMVTSDDEMETLLVVQGDDAEVEGMRVEFDFQEKGMVRVKGLFEDQIKG